MIEHSTVISYLKKYFTVPQLNLIEIAFEQTEIFKHPLKSKAIKFGEQYKHPKSRLRAILNNILENNGVFKP